MNITSPAFGPQARIPKKYSGEGEDISPPLHLGALPSDAEELALIVEDPDAPRVRPFIHWVLYKIPAKTTLIPEAIKNVPELLDLGGARQGSNDFSKIGYGGPMPPPGHGVHHYHFRLHALDRVLDLPPGIDAQALRDAMAGHVIAEADLVGIYERK